MKFNVYLSVIILLMAALVAAFFWGNGKADELKKSIRERESLVYMLDEAKLDYELLEEQRLREAVMPCRQPVEKRKAARKEGPPKTPLKPDCIHRHNPSVAEWLCKQKKHCCALGQPP